MEKEQDLKNKVDILKESLENINLFLIDEVYKIDESKKEQLKVTFEIR